MESKWPKVYVDILNFIYDTVAKEFISSKVLYGIALPKLTVSRKYLQVCLGEMYKAGLLARKSDKRYFKYQLSKTGLGVRLIKTRHKRKQSNNISTKRGICDKCGNKNKYLTLFRGQFVCRECFLVYEDLKVDNYVYRRVEALWEC